MDDEAAQRSLLHDVVFMTTVGMRPIIVHGGGKAITRAMNEAGLEPVWVAGPPLHRPADAGHRRARARADGQRADLPDARRARLQGDGPAHAQQLRAVRREDFLHGEDGRKIDLGFVGKVTDVNAKLLYTLLRGRHDPGDRPDGHGQDRRQAERQRRHRRRRGGRGRRGREAGHGQRHARHPPGHERPGELRLQPRTRPRSRR